MKHVTSREQTPEEMEEDNAAQQSQEQEAQIRWQEQEVQRLREETETQRRKEEDMRQQLEQEQAEEEQRAMAEEQQQHEKATVQEEEEDDWEDDEWNDAPKSSTRQQQQERPVHTASQNELPATSDAEDGWDDDGWCVDEKAERKPAQARQWDAAEPTTSSSRARVIDLKQAAPELENETCAPSSSDEAEMSHGSVTPTSTSAIDECYPAASFLTPAKSREVSTTDVNAIRGSLLGFRGMAHEAPLEIMDLRAVEDETALRMDLLAGLASPPTSAGDKPDRKIFGSRKAARGDGDVHFGMRRREGGRTPTASNSNRRAEFLPAPSANAYRPKSAAAEGTSREQEFKRSVQSLMNKVCPENVGTISGRILALKVSGTEELEVVITIIMKKAYSEPHYCETYADLVYNLKAEMPEFPSPDGGKPISFKPTLLNCCQNEFEKMVGSAAELSPEEVAGLDQEEIALQKQQRKARTLANMKFIGHLFLRQLLTAKIIGSVIKDLAMCDAGDCLPGEHVVECICELLNSIGYTLETMPSGKDALVQVCGRLMDLKQRRDKNGKGAYCKRIQFQIQDLLDTRAAGWTKKVFKAAAKTKEEIRNEQDRDIKAQSAGKVADSGLHVIAGARPSYLTAGSTASVDGCAWQEVPKGGRR